MVRGGVLQLVNIARRLHAVQRIRRRSTKPAPDPTQAAHWNTPRRHSTQSLIYTRLRYAVMGFLAYHITTDYFYTLPPSEGISMLPTISSFGDWVLISKYYRKGRGVVVGDVVSYKIPTEQPVTWGVKRVIGMPGDFVLRDTPGKSNTMIQVPEGHCWIVGDNLTWSRDSRMFGPVPLALISGKVVAKVAANFPPWPELLKYGLQPSIEDGLD